jgi:hypothetical protein
MSSSRLDSTQNIQRIPSTSPTVSVSDIPNGLHHSAENIPKELNHSARRCRNEGAATLGNQLQTSSTLKGLNPIAAESWSSIQRFQR